MMRWDRNMVMLGGALLVGTAAAVAGESHGPMKAASPEFTRVKALVGTWQGTTTTNDQEQPAAAEYRLTSGGSAVVETLFPGTEHEMVSVYHDRNGKLSMTHYCMLGNQPQLDLVNAAPDRLEFSLAKASDINEATEQHMHALTVSLPDANHMTQSWTCFEDGKPNHTTVITLSRVAKP